MTHAVPPPRISVVVNARDEERRLPWAIASVRPWANEIVVVDMASRDRTADVARDAGAVVVPHPDVGFVEPARRAGCEAARGTWILILDADEMVPAALGWRLVEIAGDDTADAVRMSRRNLLFGAEVVHSGWNLARDRHLRFFRRGAVVLPDRLHGPIEARPGARLIELGSERELALVHFNYVDVEQFLSRLNKYTSIEARQETGPTSRWPLMTALRDASREWFVRYVWHHGYRDGWRGFYLAWFMATYRIAVHAKGIERASAGDSDAVERVYRDEANRVLDEYRGQ